MANNLNVYQQTHNVSIPKQGIKEIIEDEDLSKTDLRVLLALLTELDGFSDPNERKKDPLNFKIIDIDSISDFLDIKYKEVKKSIKTLLRRGYLEKGDSDSVSNGYRFTF